MTQRKYPHHDFPENCSSEELRSRWNQLVSENQQLREVGERYSNTRELEARGLMLRLQAAFMTSRLNGDQSPLHSAETMMDEFMMGKPPPATVDGALNFAITYLIHGSADASELPEGLVAYFKEKADALRAQPK